MERYLYITKKWYRKMWIKIVYNFNPSNNFDIEWENLESQIKEYTKNCQTNGWEILFSNEIIDNASNPQKYILFVITKEIELYVVSYENFAKSKNQNVENKLLTHNVLQRINEFMTYKKFFLHMRQLNNEQKVIGDDIIYQKIKNLTKPIHIFFIGGARIKKTFILMCIIQNILQYYTKQLQMLIL
jgi:hypothetical protein